MAYTSSRPHSYRFGGSKVKTGCITCKARHVKCDEGRPTCQRCLKSKRQCEGYVDLAAQERNTRDQLVIVNYVPNIPQRPSPSPDADWRETRALYYFQTRTALELGGAFPTELWSRFMLLVAENNASVKHAVIALGSIHEYFTSNFYLSWDQPEFAMQQYGKAIKQVLNTNSMSSEHAVEIALLTCILFSSFESLNGHYHSSLSHIVSGRRILVNEQSKQKTQKSTIIPYDMIYQVLQRYESQIMELGDVAYKPPPDGFTDIHLSYPAFFTSLDDALYSLEAFHNSYMRFLLYAEPAVCHPENHPEVLPIVLKTNQDLKGYFSAWSVAFDQLLKSGPPDIPAPIDSGSPSALVLRISEKTLHIMLNLDLGEEELAFDAADDTYGEIVGLIEEFINKTSTFVNPRTGSRGHSPVGITPLKSPLGSMPSSSSPTPIPDRYRTLKPKTAKVVRPTFSVALGVVPHLYMASARCRDPFIRKRALRLLQTCNRREGIWDSEMSGRVAERLISIEENAALMHLRYCNPDAPQKLTSSSQIPGHVRIKMLDTFFGPGRQGKIKYTMTVPDLDENGNIMEPKEHIELLEW